MKSKTPDEAIQSLCTYVQALSLTLNRQVEPFVAELEQKSLGNGFTREIVERLSKADLVNERIHDFDTILKVAQGKQW